MITNVNNKYNLLNTKYKTINNNNHMEITNPSSIDFSIKLDISRQMAPGKWDVVKLMDIFKRELVARERCENFENLSIGENSDNMYENKNKMYEKYIRVGVSPVLRLGIFHHS